MAPLARLVAINIVYLLRRAVRQQTRQRADGARCSARRKQAGYHAVSLHRARTPHPCIQLDARSGDARRRAPGAARALRYEISGLGINMSYLLHNANFRSTNVMTTTFPVERASQNARRPSPLLRSLLCSLCALCSCCAFLRLYNATTAVSSANEKKAEKRRAGWEGTRAHRGDRNSLTPAAGGGEQDIVAGGSDNIRPDCEPTVVVSLVRRSLCSLSLNS